MRTRFIILVALTYVAALTGCAAPGGETAWGLLRITAVAVQSVSTATPHAPAVDHSAPATAFVNVNVITMERAAVTAGQTVLIRGERIVAMGAAGAVPIPPDATVIDGAGGYLMPGLADMHVHLSDERYLLLNIANGVTTVRNMAGRPYHLEWRAEIATGERLGPTIITAGPLLNGVPWWWPIKADVDEPGGPARLVNEQKALGYDFIKVYDELTGAVYVEIMDAADAAGMPVAGHVPGPVDLAMVLERGQRSIEHLGGYLRADGARLPDLVATTAAAQVWNCPTLVALQPLAPVDEDHPPTDLLAIQYLDPMTVTRWYLPADFSPERYTYGAVDARRLALVAALHKAGAPLLLGTDAPSPGVVPGFAIHQELANLVRAGLTPYAALRAGTIDAARFLDQVGEFGVVAPGARADLLLLTANPLEDVAHVAQQAGVMVRGRWLAADEIDHLLATQMVD